MINKHNKQTFFGIFISQNYADQWAVQAVLNKTPWGTFQKMLRLAFRT